WTRAIPALTPANVRRLPLSAGQTEYARWRGRCWGFGNADVRGRWLTNKQQWPVARHLHGPVSVSTFIRSHDCAYRLAWPTGAGGLELWPKKSSAPANTSTKTTPPSNRTAPPITKMRIRGSLLDERGSI